MAIETGEAIKIRRAVRRALNTFKMLALFMVATLVLTRFGWPKLDGLPTIAAAVLTVFVATTSLLYNRARAYGPSPIQRRSLHAAEQALRATLLLVIGIALTAAVFYWLPDSQRTDPGIAEPKHVLPTLLAMPCGLLFGFAAWAYVGSLQTLLPPMISPLRARKRFRREVDRGRKSP